MAHITHLYRYPIKGLSPESLSQTPVFKAQGLPLDRRFALAQGDNDFDSVQPQHQSKTNYLMLMKNEKLAALHSSYHEQTGYLTLKLANKTQIHASLRDSLGVSLIEDFFHSYLAGEIRGQRPRLVEASEHMFSDVAEKVLSVINLNSVRALSNAIGTDLNPLRFRANVYIDDLPAWAEFDWQQLIINQVQLHTLKPIQRCAATNVNVKTGQRDQQIPQTLLREFGRNHLGMYMTVINDGILRIGDQIQ